MQSLIKVSGKRLFNGLLVASISRNDRNTVRLNKL